MASLGGKELIYNIPYSGKFSRGIKFRVFRVYSAAENKHHENLKFAVLVAYAWHKHVHAEERVNLRRQMS